MVIDRYLDGNWHEYSGGSKPGSRLIRFLTRNLNDILVKVFYVFDYGTGETELISFEILQEYFKKLTDQLSKLGDGYIEVKDSTQDFIFELRLAEGCL